MKMTIKYPKIYINPGHSNSDPGASKYITERKYCVKTAKYMKEYLLENYYCKIKMTDGKMGNLVSICREANEWDADLFVSIHCNAGGGVGYENWLYSSDNIKLGQIFENKIKNIGQSSRGVKYDKTLIVLNSSDMPAILNELLFVDSKTDYNKWAKKQKTMGIALAKATAEYLHLEKKNPTYKVVCNTLNIREKSSVKSKKVGKLKKGDIIAGTVCGNWLKHSKGYSRIAGTTKTYLKKV